MRRLIRRPTAALMAALLSSILIFSIHRHLLRCIYVSSAAVFQHQATPYNLTVSEPQTTPPVDYQLLLLSSTPPATTDAVLLLDWEVLILLPTNSRPLLNNNTSCLFSDGSVSPARLTGVILSSHRQTLRCIMPSKSRSKPPYYVPQIISQVSFQIDEVRAAMARWNWMVYEAVSTPEDVILFAKGINSRQRSADKLRCVFLFNSELIAATNVSVSAQEVFRCPHPKTTIPAAYAGDLRISIQVNESHILPTVAGYQSPVTTAAGWNPLQKTYDVCTCTMVFNVAKFLREWVTYHSAIGVERFILYDNGSEDDIAAELRRLTAAGYNISSLFWPWEKTQEAGFSHCAATQKQNCKWMAFIDVDEFIFSPAWSRSPAPSRRMLPSLLPAPGASKGRRKVGQVSFSCLDFGPSGLKEHPAAGVTQGYTCRRSKEERHKSIVLLQAAAGSPATTLANQVHHFSNLLKWWRGKRLPRSKVAVYHYKYQAWPEFRQKFRRRVSAYVADWRTASNRRSRDRTPGLGFKAVEPPGWEKRFCYVNDTLLRDTVRRWFAVKLAGGKFKMVWEDNN